MALVRRWFERLSDSDPAPELCHPDVEIANWAESPVPGPYKGLEGVQRWWDDVSDSFEAVRFELDEIAALDDHRVLTVQRIVGRFRLTGVPLDFAWGSIIEVRDGKIASATGYASPGQAKRAAAM